MSNVVFNSSKELFAFVAAFRNDGEPNLLTRVWEQFYQLVDEYKYRQDQLRDEMLIASSDLKSGLQRLDGGFHVNSRGVLQGSALRVDISAALLDAKLSELKRFMSILQLKAEQLPFLFKA